MTILITSISVLLAAILFFYIPKFYEKTYNFDIHGHVEPGFEGVREAFKQNFARGLESQGGAAFSAYLGGRPIIDLWAGYSDGRNRDFWLEDTLVNTLSIAKGVSTITLAHLLSNQNQNQDRVKLQDPIAKWWPEFGKYHDGKENITIEHLLTHRAGIPYIDKSNRITVKMLQENSLWSDKNNVKTLDNQLSRILEAQKPAWGAGQKRGYHVFTYGLYVDQLIRRIDSKHRSLAKYFEDEIAKKYDLDYYFGLRSRDLNSRVATLRNERMFKTLPGLWQKLKFGLMVYHNDATKRAMSNPDFIVKSHSMALNKPEIRALQFPSVIGIGDARSLAKLYGILANAASPQGDKTLIKPELLEYMVKETSSPCEVDAIFGDMYNFGMATGFILIPNPYGKLSFGFPGHGLQLAFADSDTGLSYAYLTNTIANDQLNDRRGVNVVQALYKALNQTPYGQGHAIPAIAQSNGLEDFKNNLISQLYSTYMDTNQQRTCKLPTAYQYDDLTQHTESKGIPPYDVILSFFGLKSGSQENLHPSPDKMHVKTLQDFKAYLANTAEHYKTPQEMEKALSLLYKDQNGHSHMDHKDVQLKDHELSKLRDTLAHLFVGPKHEKQDYKDYYLEHFKHGADYDGLKHYFQSPEYLRGVTELTHSVGKQISDLSHHPTHVVPLIALAFEYIMGIRRFPSLSTLTRTIDGYEDIHHDVTQKRHSISDESFIHATPSLIHLIETASHDLKDFSHKLASKDISALSHADKEKLQNTIKRLRDTFSHEPTLKALLHKAKSLHGKHDEYLLSPEYLHTTANAIIEASHKLGYGKKGSSLKHDQVSALVNSLAHYLTGLIPYHQSHLPQFNLKGGSGMFDDIISNVKHRASITIPHSLTDQIKQVAHEITNVKSGSDLNKIINLYRKSLVTNIDEILHHNSKHNVDQETIKKLKNIQKALLEKSEHTYFDTKDYVENTASMLVEAGKRLSDAGSSDIQNLVNQVFDYASGLKKYIPGMHKDSFFEHIGHLAHKSLWPHKDSYSDQVARLVSNMAHTLKDKSPTSDDVRDAYKQARDVIVSHSDLLKDASKSISKSYYDSQEYLESTWEMLNEANKALAKASHDDMRNILDTVGKYIVGVKQYLPHIHHKQHGYFSNIIGHHEKSNIPTLSQSKEWVNDHLQFFATEKPSILKSAWKTIWGESNSHGINSDMALAAILSTANELYKGKGSSDFSRYIKPLRRALAKAGLKSSNTIVTKQLAELFHQNPAAYLEATKATILDAAHKLPRATNEDISTLVTYITHYLEPIKDDVQGIFHSHKPTYYDNAKEVLAKTVHDLSNVHEESDIRSILDRARKSITSSNDYLSKVISHAHHHPTLSKRITDAYYDSKDYLENTPTMLLDAARHFTKNADKNVNHIIDQSVNYLLGLSAFVPHLHKTKHNYFDVDYIKSLPDSLRSLIKHEPTLWEKTTGYVEDAKDNILDVIYPHHRKSFYDKARATLIKAGISLQGAKSHHEIKHILDNTRKSLMDASDYFKEVFDPHNKHSLAHSITDNFYQSADYLESTASAIVNAAKHLGQEGVDDSKHLIDGLSQTVLGVIHPRQKSYFLQFVDSLKPHQPGYYEQARDAVIRHAKDLAKATSLPEIKDIVKKSRSSIIDSSDYLKDLIKHKKHRNSLGQVISDSYYDSKAYLDHSAVMLMEAAKQLSHATTDETKAILEQVGDYMIGAKDYIVGHKHEPTYAETIEKYFGDHFPWLTSRQKSLYERTVDYIPETKEAKQWISDHIPFTTEKPSMLKSAWNTLWGESGHHGYNNIALAAILSTANKLYSGKSRSLTHEYIQPLKNAILSAGFKPSRPSLTEQLGKLLKENPAAYLEATKATILDAAHRLPKATNEDASALVEYLTHYLEPIESHIHTMFKPHPPGYYENAKRVLNQAVHDLSKTNKESDIKHILDRARKSIASSNDYLMKVISHSHHHPSLSERISEAYYDSRDYLENTPTMLLDAARHFTKNADKDVNHIIDQSVNYLLGLSAFVPHLHKTKHNYFDVDYIKSLPDSLRSLIKHEPTLWEKTTGYLEDTKDNILDVIYPHHRKSFYDNARAILIKAGNSLQGAKSHHDMKQILDNTRKSLIDASDYFKEVFDPHNKHSLAHSITVNFYQSADYLESTASAIVNAAKHLGQEGVDDSKHLIDGLSQTVLGVIHPRQKSYFLQFVDSLKPHQPGYYEQARDAVIRHAKDLAKATSLPEIKDIVKKSRSSIIDSSDYLKDLIKHKKHRNSLGQVISDSYYDSKAYLDHSAVMLMEAAKQLSHATTDETKAILDQVEDYMIGAKDYIVGHKHEPTYAETIEKYFSKHFPWMVPNKTLYQRTLYEMSHLKDNIMDAIYPHSPNYYERVKEAIEDTGHFLKSNADSSEQHIRQTIDNLRNKIIGHAPQHILEHINDQAYKSYYDSQTYLDATLAMLKEASQKLPNAAAEDGKVLVDQVTHYLLGLKKYGKNYNTQHTFFENVKDTFLPHSHKSSLSGIGDAFGTAWNNLEEFVLQFYPYHKTTFFGRAKDTILRASDQLSKAVTFEEKKGILDRARDSISDVSEHFAKVMRDEKERAKVSLSESLYDTRDYIESTANMISEAGRKLANAGLEDSYSIIDQAGQYLTGLRGYISPYNHKNGYFHTSQTHYQHMKDKLANVMHPGGIRADKTFAQQAYDTLGDIKDGLIDAVYPDYLAHRHPSTFYQSASNTFKDAAEKLASLTGYHNHDEKNSEYVAKVLGGVRDSLGQASDYFSHLLDSGSSKENFASEAYYNSKEYLTFVSNMLVETARRLSTASAEDAQTLLDRVGHYVVGAKDYIIDASGFKNSHTTATSNSYANWIMERISEALDYVCPPRKDSGIHLTASTTKYNGFIDDLIEYVPLPKFLKESIFYYYHKNDGYLSKLKYKIKKYIAMAYH